MEVRINKFLSQCGICSRREADTLIEKGQVTINGVTATNGCKVYENDIVKVKNKEVQPQTQKVVLAYNKPIGVTCTQKDKYAKITISQAVSFPQRVTYAGRLDKDSEGLMILTNDGDLINNMMRAANYHEKEYVVRVDHKITQDFLQHMEKGVFIDELNQTTRSCRIERMEDYTFRIVLTQGLNRQIRRMCQALGYQVKSLKRTRIMNVKLDNLKVGEYRQIRGEELSILLSQLK